MELSNTERMIKGIPIGKKLAPLFKSVTYIQPDKGNSFVTIGKKHYITLLKKNSTKAKILTSKKPISRLRLG